MTHEKIIKDERGTITIEVTLWTAMRYSSDANNNTFRYDVRVRNIPKGKRKEIYVNVVNSIVTSEEIFAAKMELWEKIKPTI